MVELVLSVVAVAVMAGLFVLGRRAKDRSHSGSRTVSLTFDPDRVTRLLADGREESVAWSDLTWVEVVCTRVRTADGASGFVLLGASEDEGCLVPLGVGHDTVLLGNLARLESFDLRTFVAARDQRPPARRVVWSREPVPGTCS